VIILRVEVGVSKRHVHLTKEVYEKLFGKKTIEIRNPIGQPGQFASHDTVDIKWKDKKLERLRVVGPFRTYSQVELAASDFVELGVTPLRRRRSGDLLGSNPVILIGPENEVELPVGLILVEKHIHLSKLDAKKHNIKDDDILEIIKNEEVITTVSAKVENAAALEVHFDSDEAIEFNLINGEEVDVFKRDK
jgi:putative phosphotransacetylase